MDNNDLLDILGVILRAQETILLHIQKTNSAMDCNKIQRLRDQIKEINFDQSKKKFNCN